MRMLVVCALVGSGCSLALKFHECESDPDCANRAVDGGAALFCTNDHMCVDPSPCSVAVPATPSVRPPLVLAGLFRGSGPTAAKDLDIRHGADLGAIELNQLGIPVTWVSCDTRSNPDGAREALRVATQVFQAVAVVGPETSDEVVRGVAPVVKQYGAVIVSPSATSPVIAQLDDGGLIWRTCPSDNLQAKVLAMLVPATAKLDLVYVDMSTYATGLQQAFTQSWSGSAAKTIIFPSGMAAKAVAEMEAPTHALLIADVDAPALVAAAHATPGLASTLFYMTDGALAPELWGSAPYDYTFLGHIKGTAPGLPTGTDASAGVFRSFSASYSGRFGVTPADVAYVANAYDAFYAIALAAVAAGSTPTGALIAANMQRMSKKGAPTIKVGPNGFEAGVNLLATGNMIDLVGASGPLDWDAAGELVSAPIQVWDIVQGANGPSFATVTVDTP
jgi:branched-chain amino acid transport system substrate-binding protein